ncbi:MAG TPA: hypothetical protein VMT54_11970 [Candidatus Cybelea sp.]|nr:hypothetical protein [Candidatus Cybelea sp.]
MMGRLGLALGAIAVRLVSRETSAPERADRDLTADDLIDVVDTLRRKVDPRLVRDAIGDIEMF